MDPSVQWLGMRHVFHSHGTILVPRWWRLSSTCDAGSQAPPYPWVLHPPLRTSWPGMFLPWQRQQCKVHILRSWLRTGMPTLPAHPFGQSRSCGQTQAIAWGAYALCTLRWTLLSHVALFMDRGKGGGLGSVTPSATGRLLSLLFSRGGCWCPERLSTWL